MKDPVHGVQRFGYRQTLRIVQPIPECVQLMGFAGAVLGGLVGMGFSLLAYSFSFGFVKVWTAVSYGTLSLYGLVCIVVGVVLAVVAGIYPARVASKMIPASALSSNV